ncbi:hypothetical protein EVAR_35542_1 [Eumeta japonica]|uniref:Uncharacterized protein n=1 Tax=Eumeta variegata TaxID=151549 RepID=A0A4C1X6H3_EUMVA|nr:hypothetical protein EVAR_35542_1 [Eumeta japonica]
MESENSEYRLEPFYTAEMFVLHRMLAGPIAYNPLAHVARRDILDIIQREGECVYFGCEFTREPRETSVLMSSPGMLPLKRRRWRAMIVYPCHSLKRRLERRSWKSANRNTPRESLFK